MALKDIEFYNSDDEYRLDYLIRMYKNFLNILVKRMNDLEEKVDNKLMHEFHKSQFGQMSLKEKNYTVQEFYDWLEKIDSYWNERLQITFLP